MSVIDLHTKDILSYSELSRIVDIPLFDLEPFLLLTKDGSYDCSIYGLCQWVRAHADSEKHLQENNIPWIILLRLTTDFEFKTLFSEEEIMIIQHFIDNELKKLESDFD